MRPKQNMECFDVSMEIRLLKCLILKQFLNILVELERSYSWPRICLTCRWPKFNSPGLTIWSPKTTKGDPAVGSENRVPPNTCMFRHVYYIHTYFVYIIYTLFFNLIYTLVRIDCIFLTPIKSRVYFYLLTLKLRFQGGDQTFPM